MSCPQDRPCQSRHHSYSPRWTDADLTQGFRMSPLVMDPPIRILLTMLPVKLDSSLAPCGGTVEIDMKQIEFTTYYAFWGSVYAWNAYFFVVLPLIG